ncbi:hypothetical protein P9443_25460 [Peribacillus frigoritolerans]|jgi:hypothetical protein|uniref:hypothetical protein n=1 Tax=Peribacillus frigoritolerans TaxID=450367 RepID=UPI002E1CE1CC|nr:hypothetical protein [Peribacillus frigoritolerans]
MSGFVTNEGKQEYINSYHEAMSYLPQPVESKMLNTDFGKVKLYKFQEEETPDKHRYCYFLARGLLHQCGKQISMTS